MGIKEELSKRIATKREKKQTTDRNKVEKQLKNSDLEIAHDFPLMEEKAQADIGGHSVWKGCWLPNLS